MTFLPAREYVTACITGMPRCGTTLLRSYLHSHPDMVFHNEVFHPDPAKRQLYWKTLPNTAIQDDQDPCEYLSTAVFPVHPEGKKVVGFKLFPVHAQKPGWEGLWQWATQDPTCRLIHIERRNILDIVISISLAKRDLIWHRRASDLTPTQPLHLPYHHFEWRMNLTQKQQHDLQISLKDKPHVHVTYEDMIGSPQQALAPVLEFLGVPNVELKNSDGLMRVARGNRRSRLENFDDLRARCMVERPEWVQFFDEPEPQSHSPESVVFYLQLYHDGDLAQHTLRRLRQHYPHARVILLSDGDDNHTYPILASEFHAEYIRGERLYGKESGGKMLQRMFTEFLKGSGDVLVKIDTDTRIDRPFRQLPTDDAVYGTPLRLGPPQGGCVLFPRAVAAKIAASNILLSPELLDPHTSWGKGLYPAFLEEHLRHTGRMSFEWTLYWACQKLSIVVKSFDDVYSTWKQGIVNSDRKYAVVHPDKFLHIDNNSIHDACIGAHSKLSTIYLDALYRSR